VAFIVHPSLSVRVDALAELRCRPSQLFSIVSKMMAECEEDARVRIFLKRKKVRVLLCANS